MAGLPLGMQSRLLNLEDEEDDDEVDRRIPATWGASSASEAFSVNFKQVEGSSASNSFATRESERTHARAFLPLRQVNDSSQQPLEQGQFSFSAVLNAPSEGPAWNSYDLSNKDRILGLESRPPKQRIELNGGQTSASVQSTKTPSKIEESRNKALEGVFRSTSVKRVAAEDLELQASKKSSVKSGYNDGDRGLLDPRLEDPSLDIDPNVRANFLTISQAGSIQAQSSSFAKQNSSLIASKRAAPISVVIAGRSIVYEPKAVDERVKSLDRHGEYIGKNQGEIPKKLKRQHKENVAERDRQMLRATAEYRILAALDPEARAKFLESLRKPFLFSGAFTRDQYEVDDIPEDYIRNLSSRRVRNWVYENSTLGPNRLLNGASLVPEPSIDNYIPEGGFGHLDDTLSDNSLNSPSTSAPRTLQYIKDALYYARDPTPSIPVSQSSSSIVRPQQNRPLVQTKLNRPIVGGFSACKPASLQPSLASSRSVEDPLSFDDDPVFEPLTDSNVVLASSMNLAQAKLHGMSTALSRTHGRLVIVRLHEPVQFSPGAISRRLSHGMIQEMQFFPTQRVALVVFLHCTEARTFLRHIKNTYEHGNAHEIRQLQISAGWYKGSEKFSLVPQQQHVLEHFLAADATRCLQLHSINPAVSVGVLSVRLGRQLGKALVRVALAAPKFPETRGTAVVEFASILDAIEARDWMNHNMIAGFENLEPCFVRDPAEGLREEKPWCHCVGCREWRKDKEWARQEKIDKLKDPTLEDSDEESWEL